MNLYKAYRNYISNRIFLVFDVIVPLCILAISITVSVWFPEIGFMIPATLFMMWDCYSDFFGFNGLCMKNYDGLEYVKTSQLGKSFIRSAVHADIIKRVLRPAVILFLTEIPAFFQDVTDGKYIMLILGMAFILGFTSNLSVNFTRYFDYLQAVYLIGSGCMIIGGVLVWLMVWYRMQLSYICIVLGILDLVVAVVTWFHMDAKIEQLYKARD